jgi:predicted RNA binding protein YcfA (HicA-like mRNA interferase family)
VKLPRDVPGAALAKALKVLGYQVTGQTGSHLRLTTAEGGKHHITIRQHDPLRLGTFAAILDDVAAHFGLSRDELLARMRF